MKNNGPYLISAHYENQQRVFNVRYCNQDLGTFATKQEAQNAVNAHSKKVNK